MAHARPRSRGMSYRCLDNFHKQKNENDKQD